MQGISAVTGYERQGFNGRHYQAPANPTQPETIEEARATITTLLSEQGKIRLALETREREYQELKRAYDTLYEDYMAAKKIAIRMLNRRSRCG